MDTRKKVLLVLGIAGALAIGIATVSVATGGDEPPLEGDALDRATAAALAHTGGGTVVESEAGDAGAAYEVGVRLDDGSVVEVTLDERFQVTGSSPEDEGAGGGEGAETGGTDD